MSSTPASWADMAKAAEQRNPGGVKTAPVEVVHFCKEDLKKNILDWEAKAKAALQANPSFYPSEEATCCFMWTTKGDFRKKLSGGKKGESLTPGKETVCAEDNLLRGGGAKFKFSAAYDNKNGWKPACKAGCATLLKTHNIIDLANYFNDLED